MSALMIAAAAPDKTEIIYYLEHSHNSRLDSRLDPLQLFGDWLRNNDPDEKIQWKVNHCGQTAAYGESLPVCGVFTLPLPDGKSFSCWIQVGTDQGLSDSYLKVVRCFVKSADNQKRAVAIADLPTLLQGQDQSENKPGQ